MIHFTSLFTPSRAVGVDVLPLIFGVDRAFFNSTQSWGRKLSNGRIATVFVWDCYNISVSRTGDVAVVGSPQVFLRICGPPHSVYLA